MICLLEQLKEKLRKANISYVCKGGMDERSIIFAPQFEWESVFYEIENGLIQCNRSQQLGLFELPTGKKVTVDEAFDIIKKEHEKHGRINND